MSPSKTEQETAATTELATDEFSKLVDKEFRPKSERSRSEVQSAVATLAEQVLGGEALIADDAVSTINAIIAEIDAKLTEQVNQILHHEELQKLEGSWRGLHHLVNNTETGEELKIRVMNVSKRELSKTMKSFRGVRWDQSPLFKKIYDEEFGTPGGEPYGCLVGDYHFDHSPQDVEMLAGMAQIGAAAHAPFIAGAEASLLGMDSWQELSNPSDVAKIFTTPEYAPWRSLRDSEDAKYLGLAMPRFLARLPYGEKTEPVEEFDFEEDAEGADSSKYCWANSAYAMAANITQSFKEYGWCSQIRGVESGGNVTGLPVHTFPTDDGGVDMKCPTEIAITERREMELSNSGLMPLSHRKNSDIATFYGAASLQKPTEYDDPDATSNARLAARLPYLFATCRFAHYLKCMVRDKLGTAGDRESMQRWLQQWILQYVEPDPEAKQAARARRPLAAAEVVVEEDESNPGYYSSKFYLRPHYQLEGLSVSLRLVSKLPKDRAS